MELLLLHKDGIGSITCSIERTHYHIKRYSQIAEGVRKKDHLKSNRRRTSEAELQVQNHKLQWKLHGLPRTDRDKRVLLMPNAPVGV